MLLEKPEREQPTRKAFVGDHLLNQPTKKNDSNTWGVESGSISSVLKPILQYVHETRVNRLPGQKSEASEVEIGGQAPPFSDDVCTRRCGNDATASGRRCWESNCWEAP